MMKCDRVEGFVTGLVASRYRRNKSKTEQTELMTWSTCGFAACRKTLIQSTISLNRITYRIIFGDREEMVVKSGKCAMPVLEMLLWWQTAETDDREQIRGNLQSKKKKKTGWEGGRVATFQKTLLENITFCPWPLTSFLAFNLRQWMPNKWKISPQWPYIG